MKELAEGRDVVDARIGAGVAHQHQARIQHHTNAISHVIPLVPPKAAHVAKPARILNIAVAQ
jgi:hypothetical protein